MKFIHMADIHLDSPFTLEDPSRSDARRAELRECFAKVFEYIREMDIPLCLISGDIFEEEYATKDTVAFVSGLFCSVPGCEFVIAPGNHDPYGKTGIYATTAFPENVHIFKNDEMGFFDFPNLNTTVYGWAFVSPVLETNPLINFKPSNPRRINLLCAHADVGNGLSRYCPVGENDIAKSGLDYVALGHIHKGQKHVENTPVPWGYPGCLVGRDYGEPGQKGAFLCEAEKTYGAAKITVTAKRFSANRYEDESLNVTGACSNAEIINHVSALIDKHGYSTDTLLRVTIKGSVSPQFTINASEIKSMFYSRLYSFELRDATTPNFDVSALEKDMTVKGEFYRALAPKLTTGTEEERKTASLALRYGLSALNGNDFIDF